MSKIHPEDQAHFHKHWKKLVDKQESISLEFRFYRRDDEIVWLQLLSSALHDQKGRLLGYLGTISDISELKEAQLKMESLALYDPLTGLANRRLFRDRLQNSIMNARSEERRVGKECR